MTPEETYAKLKQIERVFAGAQCTKKKGAPRPLFNALGRKAWKALLELVLDGHHGTVPGTPRYLSLGRCKHTELEMFSCIGNTSWVEAWHNVQRDSATYGIGMIFADLTLHESVDRWNVNSGIKYAGDPNFGVEGVAALYDDSDIAEICQNRAAAPDGTFASDVCDEYTSPQDDTGERFGIGWKQADYYSALSSEKVAQRHAMLEKHLEFVSSKTDGPVTKLDLEVLTTLAQGEQLCEEPSFGARSRSHFHELAT